MRTHLRTPVSSEDKIVEKFQTNVNRGKDIPAFISKNVQVITVVGVIVGIVVAVYIHLISINVCKILINTLTILL